MDKESKRLFFAVNLPPGVKHCIAESILPLVPNEGWKKVPEENLHVTMHFLGSMPERKIAELEEQAAGLQGFESFEAEINCAGHFGGNVLWLGFGKGNEEFGLLNSKLQQAMGTHDPKFHAHITIARNRGAEKRLCEADFPTALSALQGTKQEKRLLSMFWQNRVPCRVRGPQSHALLGAGEKASNRISDLAFSQGFSEPIGFRNRKRCFSISKVLRKQKGFAIAEKIGKEMKAMKIAVKSVELMESALGKQGSKYGRLFSVKLTQGPGQSF